MTEGKTLISKLKRGLFCKLAVALFLVMFAIITFVLATSFYYVAKSTTMYCNDYEGVEYCSVTTNWDANLAGKSAQPIENAETIE